MSTKQIADTGRLKLMLTELRLPTIKEVWPDFAARSDKEGWPAARFLAAIVEHEMAERAKRRMSRHLDEARLPPGTSLDAFDFDATPMVSKAQIMALASGDAWLDNGAPTCSSSVRRAAYRLASISSQYLESDSRPFGIP